MYNKALDILKILVNYGYEAYIVGGYPRDKILGIKTNDIDICTNAKPKEIMEIFDTDGISDIKYGAVRVIYKGVLFDVTTFRKDIKYENNRKPVKIKYVNELKKDLLRRDFTINTLCIDRYGNMIDLLNVRKDLDRKIITTVGNARYRLKEDSLRILRAIRFAAYLDFEIDERTKTYIKKYGYLLKDLSTSRKKEELDKIFATKHKEKGRELIISLGLEKYLGLNNLKDIVMCDDIIGIWSQLTPEYDYPFSKVEKENIAKVKEMLKLGINKLTVYKYGLYVASVVASIKGISYPKINNIYRSLVIYSRKDIKINGEEIAQLLGKQPGSYLREIMDKLEEEIVLEKIVNDKKIISKYVKDNYGG